MKIRSSLCIPCLVAALTGSAYAAEVDEPALLTGEIQAMDAGASTRGATVVSDRIATDFESFAGSKENASALVTGLRSSTGITLTQEGEPSATFDPPTRPMGYGNVSTSLALAKYQLAHEGITNPTPEQLKAALDGGTIVLDDGRVVEYKGVLQMRADGLGWGEIAQRLGTKLGPVVSGLKRQNAYISTLPTDSRRAASTLPTGAAKLTGELPGRGNGPHGGGKSDKGIVSAAGAPVSSSHGGKRAARVTTAAGETAVPRGQGIVTAAGHGAMPNGNGLGNGKPGIVNASGASVSASSAAGQGKGQGQGKALGHYK